MRTDILTFPVSPAEAPDAQIPIALLLQQEIRRHDFSYFIDDPPSMAQGGRGVCVPGCSVCRKQINTMNSFVDHLANDVLPKLIDGLKASG